MSDLPDPLVPADVDLRGAPGFIIDVERLLASELVAIGTAEEKWGAFMLWCRAYQQTPPGSLPNDERILAAFSGAGARWSKVRDVAIRGFILCSDGRLYHHVLSEQVMRAWKSRKAYRSDQERLRKWRSKQKETGSETQSETGFNEVSKPSEKRQRNRTEGEGEGKEERKKDSSQAAYEKTTPSRTPADSDFGLVAEEPQKPPKRATRLPEGWKPTAELVAYCRGKGVDPDRATEEFVNYWPTVAGQKGVKLDWDRTFMNRCMELAERGKFLLRPGLPEQKPVKLTSSGRPFSPMSGGL